MKYSFDITMLLNSCIKNDIETRVKQLFYFEILEWKKPFKKIQSLEKFSSKSNLTQLQDYSFVLVIKLYRNRLKKTGLHMGVSINC